MPELRTVSAGFRGQAWWRMKKRILVIPAKHCPENRTPLSWGKVCGRRSMS